MKLIVGIDPGLNTGIAVISIESMNVTTHTMRNSSIGDVCEYLLTQGEPIIVASDVKPVPRAVRKIAAAFNARLFYSKLSINDKNKLTKNSNYNNLHERDALAAAENARKFFALTFAKVDSALDRKSLSHLSTEVKEILVKGEAGNIESAITKLTSQKEVIHKKRRVRVKIQELKSDSSLALESQLREKDEIITQLNKDIEILHIRDENKIINQLRKNIDELRIQSNKKEKELAELKQFLTEGYEIIVPFREGEDVKDKIVLVERNSRMINKSKPRAIIADEYFPASAPVILRKNVEITKIGGILIVEKNKLEELIEKESFLQYLEKYKHRYEKEKI